LKIILDQQIDIFDGIEYNTAVKRYKIVIDTNVIVSALKSRNGFSYKLLSIIDDDRFLVNISVPLILEYEDAIRREKTKISLSKEDIDSILDYICFIGEQRTIYYLWRPHLKDLKDDMILELAVESESDFIITFNKGDFEGIEKFSLKVLTPKEFLKLLGEIK
jgi:putative PIN family toxin of toxin-antitoxin system